jgi:hypothetical protein
MKTLRNIIFPFLEHLGFGRRTENSPGDEAFGDPLSHLAPPPYNENPEHGPNYRNGREEA